jgi:hypothetical protein
MVLARLYTDAAYRDRFLEDPEAELRICELTPKERIDLSAIDRVGLLMASRSYQHKRAAHAKKSPDFR